jgi:hypothetical protein
MRLETGRLFQEVRAMKRSGLLLFVFSFCAASLAAKTPPKRANFSGNWILDTSQTKNVPDGLESYSMAVKQSLDELNVQTKLKGNPYTTDNLTRRYPQGGQGTGSPNGSPGGSVGGDVGVGPGPIGGVGMPVGGVGPMGPGGMPVGGVGPMGPMGGVGMPVGGVGPMGGIGMPGGSVGGPIGGEGTPAGTGGQSRKERKSTRTATAFAIYPRSAIYKLDGGESNVHLGDSTHTQATSKAAWAKGHQQLKLALTGGNGSGDGILLKEQWRLSKDGQRLLVDRTVRTPGGTSSIHLVFDKAA